MRASDWVQCGPSRTGPINGNPAVKQIKGTNIMIRKLLIAGAAVAAITAAAATAANAKVNVDVHFGTPGVYVGGPYYPSYPVYDAGYDESDDCGYKVVFKKKWNWNHSAYKIVKKKVLVCY
jgi:hypothetical protein